MNRERRRAIRRIAGDLSKAACGLEKIQYEEDYSRESMPDNLQSGDRYSLSEEYSDKLGDAIDGIYDAINTLEEI